MDGWMVGKGKTQLGPTGSSLSPPAVKNVFRDPSERDDPFLFHSSPFRSSSFQFLLLLLPLSSLFTSILFTLPPSKKSRFGGIGGCGGPQKLDEQLKKKKAKLGQIAPLENLMGLWAISKPLRANQKMGPNDK